MVKHFPEKFYENVLITSGKYKKCESYALELKRTKVKRNRKQNNKQINKILYEIYR